MRLYLSPLSGNRQYCRSQDQHGSRTVENGGANATGQGKLRARDVLHNSGNNARSHIAIAFRLVRAGLIFPDADLQFGQRRIVFAFIQRRNNGNADIVSQQIVAGGGLCFTQIVAARIQTGNDEFAVAAGGQLRSIGHSDPLHKFPIRNLGSLGLVTAQQYEFSVSQLRGAILAVYLGHIQRVSKHQNFIFLGIAGGAIASGIGVIGIFQIHFVLVADPANNGCAEQLSGVFHNDLAILCQSGYCFQVITGNRQLVISIGDGKIGADIGVANLHSHAGKNLGRVSLIEGSIQL